MTQRPILRLASDRLEVDADGVPWPTTPMDQPANNGHAHRNSNGNGHHPADPAGRPFVPVDLAELARHGIPEPELVCHGLLYRGGLHSLAGPPDCGKSTLLYLWALELLAQGQRVVLLDEESGREQVTEKLLALGATPELLDPDRLIYQDFPGRTWDGADHQALAELLERTRPALVGLDSAGAFLAVAGLSENESEHVTGFYKAVLLHAARTWNTAVVVLDHQGKADEAGRYARGSGAKLALVDVHLRVEAVVPFSRSQSGLLKLLVQKDRRRYLHRAHEIAVNVDPGEGTLGLAFTPVDHTVARDGTRAEGFPGDPAATDPALADLPPATRKLLVVLPQRRRAAAHPPGTGRPGQGPLEPRAAPPDRLQRPQRARQARPCRRGAGRRPRRQALVGYMTPPRHHPPARRWRCARGLVGGVVSVADTPSLTLTGGVVSVTPVPRRGVTLMTPPGGDTPHTR